MKKILSVMFILLLAITALHAQDEEKTAEDYVNDLSSNNPEVVITALNWFGENENKDGNDKMKELLSHNNDEVRMWAAANLGIVGDESAIDPILEQIVQERNSDVRYAMVLAITRIGITTEENKEKISELKELERNPIIKDYITKMEEKYNQD